MHRTWAGVVIAAVALLIVAGERRVLSHKPITTSIIYKREIAQIFQRRCFQCHSDRNLAMPLTTYELARPWARAIREEVLERKMPPWGAMTGFGHFSNDASLTQREIDIILSWADGGAPSGVLKVEESIPPVYVPTSPQWDPGAPDAILAADAPVAVEANSGLTVTRLDLAASFTEPRAIKGLAFRPGDRRVVRYAAVYEAASRRWLWTWTPTHTWTNLPADVVYRLPARARLTIEIGYRGTEETVNDKSELGLYFAESKTAQDAAALVIAPAPVEIKPGSGPERMRAEIVVPGARRGLMIWPELGDGATSLEVTALAPDGYSEPLLWAKDYRADWPSPFVLQEPIALPRGSKLVVTAYYENRGDVPLKATPRVTLVTAGPARAAADSRRR